MEIEIFSINPLGSDGEHLCCAGKRSDREQQRDQPRNVRQSGRGKDSLKASHWVTTLDISMARFAELGNTPRHVRDNSFSL
jgi:hypothetical protein